MEDEKFIKGIERLIRPMDVGTMLFMQTFNRLLPTPIIRRLLYASSKNSPYMGFVVEPYSLFLFHEITNATKAQSLLPDRFELLKTRCFKGDEPKYYVIIGTFNTHTSGFWGTRQESYVIAKDKKTGLLTWVIIDINTNTISVEPSKGIVDPNAPEAVYTTNAAGKIILDVKNAKNTHHLDLTCETRPGKMRKLDQRLWLEGNLSIAYGVEYSDGNDQPFSVTFDPLEVVEALDIPKSALRMYKHTLFNGWIDKTPSHIACFPYSQHFASDSPGNFTDIKDRKELIAQYKRLGDLSNYKAFSGKAIRWQFFTGVGISVIISWSLIIFLIVHFVTKH